MYVCVCVCRVTAPPSRADTADRWGHDLFVEAEQGPRQDWEKDRVCVCMLYVCVSCLRVCMYVCVCVCCECGYDRIRKVFECTAHV